MTSLKSLCAIGILIYFSAATHAQLDFDDGRTVTGMNCCPNLSQSGWHYDIAIESTVSVPEAGSPFIGIIARNDNQGGQYWGGIFPSGDLAIGYTLPGTDIRTQEQGNNLPSLRGEDATMRFEVTDNVLTLTAWQTDTPTETRSLSWTDPDRLFPRGTGYSLFINPQGVETAIEFQSASATVMPFDLVPGDYNFDEQSDIADLNLLCSGVRTGRYNELYDINMDEGVDVLDLEGHLAVLKTVRGDTNLDGKVGFDDFMNLSAEFGTGRRWVEGDFDCDRDVDFQDFLNLSANFGYGLEEGAIANVPEPSAYSFIAVTVLLWIGFRHTATSHRPVGYCW